jgi:hypothetical protein
VVDTAIALSPATAHASGSQTITASAALFSADDVGRAIAILHKCDTVRAAATAYAVGKILIAEYNQVPRVYRVIKAGTTAAANLAGTTPNYDLAVPNETGSAVLDGTAVLKYLGPGRHVWGFGIITAFLTSTTVTVAVDPRGAFAASYASLRWRLGAFGTTRGYPAAGTFHKGRLWLAATPQLPQTIWASQSSDFDNFGPSEADGTVLDTSAIAISLDDDEVNRIRWLSSFPRGLAVGTASGEFLIAAANRNAAISPSNLTADRQGDRGTDATGTPQRVGGIILFPQRGGRRLREMQYDFASDRFTSNDLTALADDIGAAGFLETAYSDTPDGMWWGLRSDGRVACLTYDSEQKLRAWTLDALGGGGIVESIAAVPDPAGTGSDLYVSVARTLNGVTTRTIEVIGSAFRADLDDAADGFFVDCGLTYSGTPVNTVTGLAHLEGREVAILADGSVRQNATVASGQVTVTGPASSTIHVGLPYQTRIVDLPPEVQTREGSRQGQPTRVVRVTLRLLDSGGGSVGGLGNRAEDLAFRTIEMNLGEAVPLFTGDRDVTTFSSWGTNGQVEITTSDPLPFTLLAIVKEVEV